MQVISKNENQEAKVAINETGNTVPPSIVIGRIRIKTLFVLFRKCITLESIWRLK
jgi:hypothetical protein